MWTPASIRLLIDQRKNRNDEYHFEFRRNKKDFWKNVSRRINRVAQIILIGNVAENGLA